VKEGCRQALLDAIDRGILGSGSVAEGEYLRNMNDARVSTDETVRWVEVCYCPTPLQEERPYWEEYFELVKVQDAHDRRKCRDENGSQPWACGDCDCTVRLEAKLKNTGKPFIEVLYTSVHDPINGAAKALLEIEPRTYGASNSLANTLSGRIAGRYNSNRFEGRFNKGRFNKGGGG